jgi:prepilin-type processing-associated H-X9-DG protein
VAYDYLQSYLSEDLDPYSGVGAHVVDNLWLRHSNGANHSFFDGHVEYRPINAIASDLAAYRNYDKNY